MQKRVDGKLIRVSLRPAFRRRPSGRYARGNTGDELCLAAALARVRREFGPTVSGIARRKRLDNQVLALSQNHYSPEIKWKWELRLMVLFFKSTQ